MRAVSVSAVLLLLSAGPAVAPLAAQRQELTLLAGGNFSGASGDRVAKSTARTGFQVGLSLRLPRSPMLSFQTELLVIQRRFLAERASTSQGPRSDAPNLLYAQIPLLMRVQRGYSTQRPLRPFLLVGPYIAVRMHCRRELVEASGQVSHPDCGVTGHIPGVDPYFPAVYQDVDVGVIGELGIEIRRFSLGVRGEKSVRNIVDPGAIPTSPLDKARVWTVAVSAEYLLRVM
ncbi:MAG TPA: porin family protein [Gemmatimonadales bacterium]|nr:porin family protein [Gemmatimonadales bacterium]